jgi:transglutaminase-like putative cysteine protease
MRKIRKQAALLLTAAVIVLAVTAAAPAKPINLGMVRYTPALSDAAWTAVASPSAVKPPAAAAAADVTVSDYDALIAAVARLYVARDTQFRVRYDGISRKEAGAILDGNKIWEDVFSYDLKETTSDLDYLRFNMRGTMQVNSWSYGSFVLFEFSQSYWTTAEQEAYVDETVAAILDELNISELSQGGKVRAIHDYIVHNVEYDDTLTKYSAYDALYSKRTVCNGYTLLMYKMLAEAGVPVRAISGKGFDGGRSENHAWNIVRIGPVWYNIDVTWNDTARTDAYFLKGAAGFADHVRDSQYDTDSFHAAHPMSPVDFDPSLDVTPIRSIAFGIPAGAYAVGSRVVLPVSISPAGAAGGMLVWSSSDPEVAAVDESGVVTVLSEGVAFITVATADGGGLAATFTLTAVGDSPPSDWAAADIMALTARGVVPEQLQLGYQLPIRRGEFTALMVNVVEQVLGPYTTSSAPPFEDIAASPYSTQITAGYQLGLINGMSAVSFEPEGTLTREQCAKIISIAAGLISQSGIESDASLPFNDSPSIQSWAVPYVQYAFENGLMQGTGSNFEPAGLLTREQAMVIAERMIKRYGF